MKDYSIKIVDGHHVVHMLSEEEIQMAKSMADTIEFLLETAREIIDNFVEAIRNIVINLDLEKLKEHANVKHSTQQSGFNLSADAARETGLIYARHSRH